MTGTALDAVDHSERLASALSGIEWASMQFPVSQVLVPLADTLDWLLDDVATERYWLDTLQTYRSRFAPRWERIAARALGEAPREITDRALRHSDYDPLDGREHWGVELTRALRAVLGELQEFGDEDEALFRDDRRTRAFIRGVRTQTGSLTLPVLSYVPLREREWRAILDSLNEVIDLALRFEGAAIVWVIGGYTRDVDGRLQLRPQLSVTPPTSGTRVKPLRVLLGTAYEEQCPSLLPLVWRDRSGRPRPSDSLLTGTRWHRLVVQFDVAIDDYVLLDADRLSEVEHGFARRVMYLDRRVRPLPAVLGEIHDVPRPWQRPGPLPEPPVPAGVSVGTYGARSGVNGEAGVDQEAVHEDAEMLRAKGMAMLERDPALAQKYLLSSTVLENTSVDVWLALVEIATSEAQRTSFRREAEKVLRRQRLDQ